MKRYINKQNGEIINSETFEILSYEGKLKFTEITDNNQQGMTIGEGMVGTALVVALSPVILIKGILNL